MFRQTEQPQPHQMLGPARSLRRTVRPLAASLQVLDQTALKVEIELTENAGRVPEGKVVHPASHVPIQLAQ